MQITRTRGDTYPERFVVSYQDNTGPVNLTGCTLKMSLNTERNPVDASTQVWQITGDVPTPTTGEVFFSPSEEQANQVGMFYFDVELTDSWGKKYTLVKDVIQFDQDITK